MVTDYSRFNWFIKTISLYNSFSPFVSIFSRPVNMHENFSFELSRFPRIVFGEGVISALPEKIKAYGEKVLLVTGQRSLQKSGHWQKLINSLQQHEIKWFHCRITGEPSPEFVDAQVTQWTGKNIQCVVAIGGGSALDAGKAISGLLPVQQPVMNYLEGVGLGKTYPGPALPFIAVPTTAGTGSEATKNAVLSQISENGFKKSFRDEQLIPEYALIDPALLENCPKSLIAANGLDALTQLIESYVSTRANPFTDALALSGLQAVRDSLLVWYQAENSNEQNEREQQALRLAQAKMAYAALISGITLAQVGLGSVHGLASPLGAFFPIPHGVACGTLLADATHINIQAMQQRMPDSIGLQRYAELGRLMSKQPQLSMQAAHKSLIQLLRDWTEQMELEPLSAYGVTVEDVPRLVSNISDSSMKTNPIILTQEEKAELVLTRLHR